MDDLYLERLALIAIIVGLLVLLFLMPSYEFVDAHYLFEDDNRAFLEGEIKKISFSDESGWSFIEVESCRVMDGFFEGEIDRGVDDVIFIKGSFVDGSFNIDEYK